MAVYESKYKEELQNSLRCIDKKWQLKHYTALLELIELHRDKTKSFSAYVYFIENINSENLLNALGVFGLAIWLGGDWPGETPDSGNLSEIKKTLTDLCLNGDEHLAASAFEALDSLCDEDDDIWSIELLRKLFTLSEGWSSCMRKVLKFPVRKDTIPHLQGLILADTQKEKLEKLLHDTTNPFTFLNYFWFGVMFGAWDIEYVVQETKRHLASDEFSEFSKKGLRKKIKTYLSILQEASAVPEKCEDSIKDFLDELSQLEKKKEDIFDW